MANEKRLIDIDLAIERAKESDKIVKSSIWETCEVVEFLEDCPIEDAVEVVYCEKCVNHGNCLPEDVFRMTRIEKPYCCAGKVDGDRNA